MTQGEFKAWFEGFSEAIGEVPTKKQWARIKERAAEIDGKTVTERVYIDRYVDRYWPARRWYGPYYSDVGAAGIGGVTYTASATDLMQGAKSNQLQGLQSYQGVSYSSTNAMYALGKDEGLRDAA